MSDYASMVRYFSMHSPAGTIEQVGPLKFRIADIIVVYHPTYGSLAPWNLINIQNPITRTMPKELLEVRRLALLKYGRTKSSIRCGYCGKRMQHKDLVSVGICRECADERSKSFVIPQSRVCRERSTDADFYYRNMHHPNI